MRVEGWVECIIDRVNYEAFTPKQYTPHTMPRMFFTLLSEKHGGDHCAMALAAFAAITGDTYADLREDGDEDETIMIRHTCRDQMARAYPLPDYYLEFDLLKVCCAYII